jgi:putative flippase GtrA
MFSIKFLKFGVVGIIGVGIDFFITWLCKEKMCLNKYVSNAIGFSFAVINNFLLNRYWTFEANNQAFGEQFLKFVLIAIAGLAINSLFLFLIHRFLQINFYVTKLLVIGLVFFWNFYMNYLFTFH